MKLTGSALTILVCLGSVVAFAQSPATRFAPPALTPAAIPATSSATVSSSTSTSPAVASTKLTPVMYQNIDIAPLVEDAKASLVETTQEFRTYHWSARNYFPRWKNSPLGHEPAIIADAKMYGNIYWKTAGPGNMTGSMFGNGLYVAADPVATFGYANGSDFWEVMEFKVPAGLHLVNTIGYQSSGVDPTVRAHLLNQFTCDANMNVWSAFTGGGTSLSQKCFDLVKHIYKDILKADGLIYGYGVTSFTTCDGKPSNKSFAIVFFDGNWMNASNVQYYIRFSRNNTEERRIIQTLFMGEEVAQQVVEHAASATVATLLATYPNYHVMPAHVTCSSSACSMTVTMCDEFEINCQSDYVNLPLPYSPILKKPSVYSYSSQPFLWDDLDGQKRASADVVSAWLKKNRLGCDGTEFIKPAYPAKGTP